MNSQPENPYVGYEYKEIQVAARDLSLYLDAYENFGWLPENPSPADPGRGTVTLHFKRSRKIINKMELTRLQRNFESCMEEIHQMERAPGQAATAWALGTALAGTAFMAGAVFAVTGEPPRYLAMILLAVPGFAGWLLALPVYRRVFRRQRRKLQPFIDAKYNEIDQLCEKGHSLL